MYKDIIFHFRDRDWLYKRYIGEGLTCLQIANLCHCHPGTIHKWLAAFNIPRRHNTWVYSNLLKWRNENQDWVKHSKKKRHPLSNETREKLSIIRSGSGNARWKGGITAKIRGIRRSPEYYQWRKAVLVKYKGICQRCGSSEKPQAHHKLCVVDFPSRIFDIENGEVLCRECHKELNFTTNGRIET